MKLLCQLVTGLAAAMVATSAQAAHWSPLGVELAGKSISAVAVDPGNPQNLAAVANGQLYLSDSGGLLWQAEPVIGARDVIYDPSHPGRIVATVMGQCLLIRDRPGASWQPIAPALGSCNAESLVATADSVYLLSGDGSGNTILRLHGQNLSATAYGSSRPRPYYLAADPHDHSLYVAATADAYRSDDGGDTWETIANPATLGCCISALWTGGDSVWMMADGHPFRSEDQGGSWQAQGSVPDNYVTAGLVVHADQPYFGLAPASMSSGDVAVGGSLTPQALGLGQMAYYLAVAGDRLIAGNQSGLWQDDDPLPDIPKAKRPVIVIPGIMGSWPSPDSTNGQLVLDPLTHTYDAFMDRLRQNGFSEAEHTLYAFPYDWRQDNDDTSRQLAQLINQVKHDCHCAKVDLVAHSMGALVARQYVQGDKYGNDVNKLIELSPPNRGSLLAYYMWEGGDFYNDGSWLSGNNPGARLQDDILKALLQAEGLMHGYLSFTDYVRQRVSSVGQLLPDYNYIQDRTYPTEYPRNQFLEQLNSASGISRLRQRIKLYVIGSESGSTLTSLITSAETGGHGWPEGRVLGTTSGSGDGTVPADSLNGLDQINNLFNASHGGIVTDAADTVIKYLKDEVAAAPPKPAATSKPKPPHKAVVVTTRAKAKLKVSSKSGKTVKSYRYSDDVGQYVVITDPDDDSSDLVLAVDSPDPVEAEVTVITDDSDQTSSVTLGGALPSVSVPVEPTPPLSQDSQIGNLPVMLASHLSSNSQNGNVLNLASPPPVLIHARQPIKTTRPYLWLWLWWLGWLLILLAAAIKLAADKTSGPT